MKKGYIVEKLSELGFELEDFGVFDVIRVVFKGTTSTYSELNKTAGKFFLPNYENDLKLFQSYSKG